MDFGLSEEQRLLQDTIRGFAANECPPAKLRALFEAANGRDPALWSGLTQVGAAGLALPEVCGGSGLEVLDLALAAEVLGESALPVPFLGHALATVAFGEPGERWQPEEWTAELSGGASTRRSCPTARRRTCSSSARAVAVWRSSSGRERA